VDCQVLFGVVVYIVQRNIKTHLIVMVPDDGGIFEGEAGWSGFHAFNSKCWQWDAVGSCKAARHWEREPGA
jgi:hypothetical protein